MSGLRTGAVAVAALLAVALWPRVVAAEGDDADDAKGGDASSSTADGSASKAPTKKLSTPPPKRLHVVLYAAKGMSESERLLLEASLAEGVRDGGGKIVKTGHPKLRRPGGKAAAKKALSRGDKSLAEAQKRVRNLDFDGALDVLDWASEEYAKYLPQLFDRDGGITRLRDVFVQATVINYLNGDEKAATKALARAFVLDPMLTYDKKTFPPQLEQFVEQERALFEGVAKGSLRVTVKGGPATVYVNGLDRGKAPVVVHDLYAGPNTVTVAAPGVEPVAAAEVVKSGDVAAVTLEIKVPASKLTGPMAKTRGSVGDETVSSTLTAAAKKLGADGLILALPTVGEGSIALVVYVYDLRSGAMVGRFEGSADRASPKVEASDLGRTAFKDAKWRLAIPIFVGPERTPFWKKKFWRHKYFWPAVGTAAGVVLLGIVIKSATGGGLSNGQKVGIFPVVQF